jgi:integrase
VTVVRTLCAAIHWVFKAAFRERCGGDGSGRPARCDTAAAAGVEQPLAALAREAGRLLSEAWKDPEWGAFVWTAMRTGGRRGELCALRHGETVIGAARCERTPTRSPSTHGDR